MSVRLSYLPVKDTPSELKEIKNVIFTNREVDIISCILSGKSAATISSYLDIAQKTVETHVRNIMLKLGCNSREIIINFVEQSKTFDALHAHYYKLLFEYSFSVQLKKIHKLIGRHGIKCSLFVEDNVEGKKDLLEQIALDLKKSGITVITNQKEQNIENDINKITFTTREIIHDQSSTQLIYLTSYESYYHIIFDILKNVLNKNDFKKLEKDFTESYDAFKNGLNPISSQENLDQTLDPISGSNKLGFLTPLKSTGFLILIFFIIAMSIFKNNNITQNIRSELIIPSEPALLKRTEITTKMHNSLSSKNGIKTIALTGVIGIGGAGKTVIARYYGKSISKASIVWELNAETKDTLINSFRDLANNLANNDELKHQLSVIDQNTDPKLQEKLMLNFVKDQLHKNSNWLLIYDNLESFEQINHLFPNDSKKWGNGNVIITTRNEHIIETSFIKPDDVVHIDELSINEMQSLFSRILYDQEPEKLSRKDRENTILFLKNIPPFPLEVSMAGYSIKNTHITFEQYLKNISEYSNGYDSMQSTILKEATNYTKTRYGIIASTIEKLNSSSPKFKEIFFFICLLDSQNIPYNLIAKYKDTKEIDDFIYNLRKNGILIRQSYSEFAKYRKKISIHRSTQEIGAAFLTNSLSKKEKEDFIKNAITAIKSFYEDCSKNKEGQNILQLIPHLNSMLNAVQKITISQNVKEKYETDLYLLRGDANFKWLKNFVEANKDFTNALEKSRNDKDFSPASAVSLLKNLGHVNTKLSNPTAAVKFNNMSIELCKKLGGYETIIADNLQSIGTAYRQMNNFQKSKEALDTALAIIPQEKYQKEKELVAEIYIQLASLYLANYIHKKEGGLGERYYKDALNLFYGSEDLYQDRSLIATLPASVGRHMCKYAQFFMYHHLDYDTANKWIKEAEYIMQQKCPENLQLNGRISGAIAEISLRKNNLVTAEQNANNAINWIALTMGPDSTWFYNVIRAEILMRLGKFQEAYNDAIYVQNIKFAFSENNPINDLTYWTSAYHAGFAMYKLGDYEKSSKHFEDFMKNLEISCKSFLDNQAYATLLENKAFEIIPYNKEHAVNDIKTYLDNSLKIFIAIYGKSHLFVKDYIAMNSLH